MMIRVAFNAVPLLSPLTGIGSYTYHLATELRKINAISPSFFYGKFWSDDLVAAPNKVSASPIKKVVRDFLPFAYDMSRHLQQFQFERGAKIRNFDLYHEPNFLAFKFDGPSVITVHDLSWIMYPETHPKQRVLAMERYFEKGLKRAAHIITDSLFIKNELVDVFGLEPENITPIALGFSNSYAPVNEAAAKSVLDQFDLQYRQYFLLLGTLEPRKNISTVLEAFLNLPKAVRQQYPLVIVGMKGWHTSELEKKLASLVKVGEVRVLGYISGLDLRFILAGAMALLYPSIYEGFGLPPLEAMACEVPVIASNVSAIPEVVADTGILVNPFAPQEFSEAMMDMINSPTIRSSFASKGLSRSKMFSWDRCATETYGVYHRVAS